MCDLQFALSCTIPQPQSRSSPRFVTGFFPLTTYLPLLPFVVDGACPFILPSAFAIRWVCLNTPSSHTSRVPLSLAQSVRSYAFAETRFSQAPSVVQHTTYTWSN